MVIVTLTTDWGDSGLYLGMFKAKLIRLLPGVQIVDVSHTIPVYHVEDAVFALRNAYKYFPPKTIHVVSVASKTVDDKSKNREFICFQYNYQYFIGPNNGLWEMLLDVVPNPVYKIGFQSKSIGNFPESDVFVETIGKLALGGGLDRIGTPVPFTRGMRINQPQIDDRQIIGNYLYFDSYGNGITNISKEIFEQVGKGRLFTIMAGRENVKTDVISTNYHSTTDSVIALFNVSGFLELAMPYYSLKSHLFIDERTRILIRFYDSEAEKDAFKLF